MDLTILKHSQKNFQAQNYPPTETYKIYTNCAYVAICVSVILQGEKKHKQLSYNIPWWGEILYLLRC